MKFRSQRIILLDALHVGPRLAVDGPFKGPWHGLLKVWSELLVQACDQIRHTLLVSNLLKVQAVGCSTSDP